jgi:SAM-dependent methyltransferase
MEYPGDFVTLEGVYRNSPMSTGIGYFLDLYFMRTTLAVAVRQRKEMMRDILKEEIQKRQSPAILNIACGSCREMVEIAHEIEKANATLICVDIDPKALDFSASRFAHSKLPQSQIQFRKYNAMRMIKAERNLKEFGPQDIVYSTGLFDYLEENTLARLLEALYIMLKPGGTLITSFKDKMRYTLFPYHWLVNWASFFQRTEEDIRRIFDSANIPPSSLSTKRIENGAIFFLLASK